MAERYANSTWSSKNIYIEGNKEFINSVIVMLNQIWHLQGGKELKIEYETKGLHKHNITGGTSASHIGQKFIKILDNADKKITIKTGVSFACAASTKDAYFPLANESWNNRSIVIPLLKGAIDRSYYTVKSLAQQLAAPGPGIVNYAFTPKQVGVLKDAKLHKTGTRVSTPSKFMRLESTKGKKSQFKLIKNAAAEWEEALTTYLSNPHATGLPEIKDGQQKLICRKLEPWLDKGKGNSATVTCNLNSKESTCLYDGTRKKRPVALGFVHELIHAYYGVTGTRLFYEGSVQDEAITAGIPPEHLRPFTENRFRAIWPDERVDLRLFYSFGMNACPYCGYKNLEDKAIPKDKRKPGGPKYEANTTCNGCGEEVLSPVELKGPGGLLLESEL